MSHCSVSLRTSRFVGLFVLGLVACFTISSSLRAAPQEARSEDLHFIFFDFFDAPGSGTASGQGTLPICINDRGEVMGLVQDSNNVFHGFLRSKDGTITTYDVTGAGTGANQGTFAPGQVPEGFNDRGDIAGNYVDSSNISHSFVRSKDGTIITFDAPESVQGSFANGINNRSNVSGAVNGANYVRHAYIRNEYGRFTIFDAPGAGIGGSPYNYQGTIATAINDENTVVGIYKDSNNVRHAYVRDKDGVLTEFDVPGAGGKVHAYAFSINNNGEVSGFYTDSGGVFHGYLRSKDGTIVSFDVSGAGSAPGQGTTAYVLNEKGDVTGYYVDANNVDHGFVRRKNGRIFTFDVPGAGAGAGQGTTGMGINAHGDVVGYYTDTNNVSHGFVLRRPD